MDEIIDTIPEPIEREVTQQIISTTEHGELKDDCIRQISLKFQDNLWMELGEKLGVNATRLNIIKFNHIAKGNEESCYQMLKIWKKNDDKKATLHALYNALRLIGREDVISSINERKSSTSVSASTNNFGEAKTKPRPPNVLKRKRTGLTAPTPMQTKIEQHPVQPSKPVIILATYTDQPKPMFHNEEPREASEIVPKKTQDNIHKRVYPSKFLPQQEKTESRTLQEKKTKPYATSETDLTEDDLRSVSNNIVDDSWVELGKLLGIKQMKIGRFKFSHYQAGIPETCYQMLLAWMKAPENEASKTKLNEAMNKLQKSTIHDKEDLQASSMVSTSRSTITGKSSVHQFEPYKKIMNKEISNVTPQNGLENKQKNSDIEQKTPITVVETSTPEVVLRRNKRQSDKTEISATEISATEIPIKVFGTEPHSKVDQEFNKLTPRAEVRKQRNSHVNREFDKIIPEDAKKKRNSSIEREFVKIVPKEVFVYDDGSGTHEDPENEDDVFTERKAEVLPTEASAETCTPIVQENDVISSVKELQSKMEALIANKNQARVSHSINKTDETPVDAHNDYHQQYQFSQTTQAHSYSQFNNKPKNMQMAADQKSLRKQSPMSDSKLDIRNKHLNPTNQRLNNDAKVQLKDQIEEEFEKLIPKSESQAKRNSEIDKEFQKIVPEENEHSRDSLVDREFLKIVPVEIEVYKDNDEEQVKNIVNAPSSHEEPDEQVILRTKQQTPQEKRFQETVSLLPNSKAELVDTVSSELERSGTYTAKICQVRKLISANDISSTENSFSDSSPSTCNMKETVSKHLTEEADLVKREHHEETDLANKSGSSNIQDEEIDADPVKITLKPFYKLQQIHLEQYQICQADWQSKTLSFPHNLKDVYSSMLEDKDDVKTVEMHEIFNAETPTTPKKILVTSDLPEMETSFISKLISDWIMKERYIWSPYNLIMPLDVKDFEDDLESMMIKYLNKIVCNHSMRTLDILTLCKEKTLLILYNFAELYHRARTDLFRILHTHSCPYTVILVTSPYEIKITHHDIESLQITSSRSKRINNGDDRVSIKFWDQYYDINKISDPDYEALLLTCFDIGSKHIQQLSEILDLKVSELYDQPLFLELCLHAIKMMNGIQYQTKTELFNLIFGFITNDSEVILQIKKTKTFTALSDENPYFKLLMTFGNILWNDYRDTSEEAVTYENLMLKKSELIQHFEDFTPLLKLGILTKKSFILEMNEECFELIHPSLKEYIVSFYLAKLGQMNPNAFRNECTHIFSNQFKYYFNCQFFNFLGGLMENADLCQLLEYIEPWSYCLLLNKYPLRELLHEVSHVEYIVNHLTPFFPPKWHIRPADLRHEKEDCDESLATRTSFASLRMKIGRSLVSPEFCSIAESDESVDESFSSSLPDKSMDISSVDHVSDASVPKYPPKWNVGSYDFYTSSLHEFLLSAGLKAGRINMLVLNPLEVCTLPSDAHVHTLILIIDSSELGTGDNVTIPQNMSCEDLMLLINTCTDEQWILCLTVVNAIKATRINVIIASHPEITMEALNEALEKEKWKNLRFHCFKVFEIIEEKGRISLSLIENLLKRGRIEKMLEVHLQNWKSYGQYSTEIKREHVENFLSTAANVGTLEHLCFIGDKYCKCVDNTSLHMNNFFNKFRQWKAFYVDGKMYFQNFNNTDDDLPVASFGFNSETNLSNKVNVLKKFSDLPKLQYCTATILQLLDKMPTTWNGSLTLRILHLDVTQPSTTYYHSVSDIKPLLKLETLILDFKNIFNSNEVSSSMSLVQTIVSINKLIVKTVRKWNIAYVETFIKHLLHEKRESQDPRNLPSNDNAVYYRKDKLFSLSEISVWFDQTNYIDEEMLEAFFSKIRTFMYRSEVEVFSIIEPNKYLKQVYKVFPISGKFKIERKVEDMEREEILSFHHQPEYCAVAPEKLIIIFADDEKNDEITV